MSGAGAAARYRAGAGADRYRDHLSGGALQDGDAVIVVQGPAGGFWVSIAGRVGGLGDEVAVVARLYDDMHPQVVYESLIPNTQLASYDGCIVEFVDHRIFLKNLGTYEVDDLYDYMCLLDATPLRLEVSVEILTLEPDACDPAPVHAALTLMADPDPLFVQQFGWCP